MRNFVSLSVLFLFSLSLLAREVNAADIAHLRESEASLNLQIGLYETLVDMLEEASVEAKTDAPELVGYREQLVEWKAQLIELADVIDGLEKRENTQKHRYPCIKGEDMDPVAAVSKIEALSKKSEGRSNSNFKIDQGALIDATVEFMGSLSGKLLPMMLETNELEKAGMKAEFLEETRVYLGQVLEAMSISCDAFLEDEDFYEGLERILLESSEEL